MSEKKYTQKQRDNSVERAVKKERKAIIEMIEAIRRGDPQPIVYRIGRGACMDTILNTVAMRIANRSRKVG